MERRNLIREMPEHDRPRERLEHLGASSLTDAELLAILLRTGTKGVSAVALGEKLLVHFGGLQELSRRSVGEIARISGIGKAKAVLLKAAFSLHQRVNRKGCLQVPLDQPRQVCELVGERLRGLSVEMLCALPHGKKTP